MGVGVGIEGLPETVAMLDHAHAALLDLTDANRAAVQLVTTDAREPSATGALRASRVVVVDGTGWGISYGKPYAVAVHWGTRYLRARPWLMDAATATLDAQLDKLARTITE